MRNLRCPQLYRAQDAWKPSLCWASCSLFLAAKTVTCQEQQICPSCILSLASSRAHTGRIRTCRTEGRGSCLLDRSAVQSVATDHSSPMGSSMNDPAGTLSFPESHRFWKKSMTTGVQKAEIHFVKYFHLMIFWSYFLLTEEPLYTFWNILFVKM